MLEFNVGELTTRLRAALTVRGRMPLNLDEHVIPTVATADVTGPPWRRSPRGFYVASEASTSANGSAACVAVGPTPGSPPATYVITGYRIASTGFVTATPATAMADNSAVLYYSAGGFPAIVAPVEVSGTISEHYETPINPAQFVLPFIVRTGRVIGAITTLALPGIVDIDRRASIDTPGPWVPCNIVLRSDGTAVQSLVLGSLALATATETARVSLAVQGLFFPGAPTA